MENRIDTIVVRGTEYDIGGSGSQAVVIQADQNKTVNGYVVPQLTDEQITQIHNFLVSGTFVVVADATGKMHFGGLNTDVVNDEVYISFRYFDKMVLEYTVGNVTTYTAAGAKLYNHRISFYDIFYGSWNLMLRSPRSTAFNPVTLFGGSDRALGAIGTRTYDGNTENVIITGDYGQEFEYNFYDTHYIDPNESFTDFVTEA